MIRIKKYLSVFFLLMLSGLGQAMAQTHQISLLTADPGNQLYSAFGHSAIRVLDKMNRTDYVFNYGTFDFDTPNFYGKFATGTLDYMLSVSTFAAFMAEYDRQGRGIREQILDLNQEQTDYLLEFLQVNYQPERRYYRYDFFYDNCATRIRVALELVLGDQLVWKDESKEADKKTFRTLIDEYVYTLTWADLGIDLALGSVIDVDASPLEEQFLPDYMFESFSRAEIQGDGPSRPLVKETRVLMEFPQEPKTMESVNPYWIFWLVAITFIAITFIGYKKKRLFIGFDLVFFSILGLIGVVVTFLWFGSELTQTKWNWNLLWAFPGHLVLVPGLYAKTLAPWVRKYLLAALILADAAVVFWILGWQSFHPSIIPLLLVVILRTNYLYYNIARYRLTSQ